MKYRKEFAYITGFHCPTCKKPFMFLSQQQAHAADKNHIPAHRCMAQHPVSGRTCCRQFRHVGHCAFVSDRKAHIWLAQRSSTKAANKC